MHTDYAHTTVGRRAFAHRAFPAPRSMSQTSLSERWKRTHLATDLYRSLDRVDVLGDDMSGHTGCVNALSWTNNGDMLLSGGDDTTVRMWKVGSGESNHHSLKCRDVIDTGHTWNIFNVKMLPQSSKMYVSARPLCSPVQDGTVRQHDTRVSHQCRSGCPPPLVKLPHPLCTLSTSQLASHLVLVAGRSPYGFLFDRRHSGRFIKEEWGVPLKADDYTTCVRRFGRTSRGWGESKGDEYITSARMSSSNAHEASALEGSDPLLAFSSDAVYFVRSPGPRPPAETPGKGQLGTTPRGQISSSFVEQVLSNHRSALEDTIPDQAGDDNEDEDEDEDATHTEVEEDADLLGYASEVAFEFDSDEEDVTGVRRSAAHGSVPTVLPRRKFVGACNIETIKDVNFLGPNEDFIVSGSDDGNWFMWDKGTGELLDILEGDGSIVNVIEGHPHLPVVAVSGIDYTVKLFAPVQGQSQYSRIRQAKRILSRHSEAALERLSLSRLLEFLGTYRAPAQSN
ncbi:WD40-repeat-containing domain protein [Gloeopeniophorella convolvens]|nr:WD40-repeat-containing domain protein [Gloeopeniophorella convolvens]